MKVLYLVSGIGPPTGWGTEYIQNLIIELSKKGVEATIISPIYKHTHPDFEGWAKKLTKQYKIRIVALHSPNWIKRNLSLHFIITPILVSFEAFKLLIKERFDLVHEFSSIPIILIRSLFFKIFFKITTIFTLSVYNNTLLGKFFWFRIFDFAKIYCIPSKEILNELKSLGIKSKKMSFTPPGINLTSFTTKHNKRLARRELKLPKDKFILSYYGSLTTEKGVGDLLEAAKHLSHKIRQNIMIALFVVWKGSSEHDFLKSQIKTAHLPHLQLYERYVDIPTLLNASDAVVLPQHTGNGTTIPPISIIEALVNKTFVITTNAPGVNEWVNKKNGILIPPGSPKILAEIITRIYSHQSNYEKRSNRKILTTFDINLSVQLHLSLYQSILSVKLSLPQRNAQ